MRKKKLTAAEHAEIDAQIERTLENARRLRELAEKGLARLEAQQQSAG
jgi:uncharacterized protein YPO0396